MRRVESLLKIKNPEPLPSRSDSNGHAHVFLKSALLACLITLSACSIPNPFNQKKATPAKSATVVAASSTPDHLELVSGNLQTGAVMAPLKDLLRFKVVNAKGEPVSHARFLISANKGGGTVTSASIESDSKGLVSIPWTLGKIAGSQSITFSGTDRFTSNPDSLTFSATATARAPSAQKSSISGSGPVTADGAQASLITIFLRDEFGNPVSGAKPAFTATDSGNSNLYGGCSASDATGISLCSLSSTTAEIKTPRLTWPVNLTGPGISFIKPSSNKPVLSFSTAPPSSATAGQVLSPAPVVSLLDSSGRVVRTRNPVVIEAFADSACTQALGSTPSGDPNLSGSTTRSALTAPATFNDLSANRAGVVFLKASSDSLDPVCSNAILVQAGAVSTSKSTLTLSSSTAPTGASVSVTFTASDPFGNSNPSGIRSLAFTASPSSSGFFDTLTDSGNGIFTTHFTGSTAGTIDLTATLNGTDSTGPETLTITEAVSTSHLAFEPLPTTAISGSHLTVTISKKDSSGNTDTTFSDTLILSSSDLKAEFPPTVLLTEGTATFDAILNTAGLQTFSAISSSGTVVSDGIQVDPGPAASLHLAGIPDTVHSGSPFTLSVTALDLAGNTVTGYPGTLTGTSSDPLAQLTGPVVSASQTREFTVTLKTVGSQTLTLTDGTLTAISDPVTVTPAAATRLIIDTLADSSPVAGSVMTFTVLAEDDDGNVDPSFLDAVTVTSSDGKADLPTTAPLTAGSGELSITFKTAGTHTFSIQAGGLSANSLPISVTPSTYDLNTLTLATDAPTLPSGSTTRISFTLTDPYGNTPPSNPPDPSTVVFTLDPATGGGSFSAVALESPATYSATLTAGSAGSYTAGASVGGVASSRTAPLTIVAGGASLLAFSTQPDKETTAGAILTSAPRVSVLDAFGNPVPVQDSITIGLYSDAGCMNALTTHPDGGSSLNGTTTRSAASGSAEFSNLSILTSGTVFLKANSGSLEAVCSTAIRVAPGAPAKLVFSTQPGNGIAGTALSTQPVVTIQDAQGNTVTTANDAVTLALGSNPGSGNVAGNVSVAAVNGVATFSGLSINKKGTGYTFSATSGSLPAATSSSFDVTASAASKLTFTLQPVGGIAGGTFTTQPVIAIQDSQGNTVDSATLAVTLSSYSDSNCSTPASTTPNGAASLAGTLTLHSAGGFARFSDLSANLAGTLYIKATSGTLTSACSSASTVSPGAYSLAQSTLSLPSQRLISGATMPVTLTLKDSYGNSTSSGVSSVAFTSSATGGTGRFGSATSASAGIYLNWFTAETSGVVDLYASINGSSVTNTQIVTITSGAATQLAFSAQPANGSQGAAFTTVVTVQDEQGNTVTSASIPVTLSIGANPSAGTLSGLLSAVPVNGVATFSGLSIDKAGTGYTLFATSDSLSVTSQAFNMAQVASSLAFSVQPGNGVAGESLANPPVVRVQDTQGTPVSSASDSVALVAYSDPACQTPAQNTPSGAAPVYGNLSANAAGGIATFSGIHANLAGTLYFKASSGSLSICSAPFTVNPGLISLANSTLTTDTATLSSGTTTPLTLSARDAFGNPILENADSILFSISSGSGNGSFSPVTQTGAGIYTSSFTGGSAGSLTVGSTIAGVTGPTATLTVIGGGPTRVAIISNPETVRSGAVFPVLVELQDDSGNPTPPASPATVLVEAFADPACMTPIPDLADQSSDLVGTKTQSTRDSLLTFGDLELKKTGTLYLKAFSPDVASADCSKMITVTAGEASFLALSGQPESIEAGSPFILHIEAYDWAGNLADASPLLLTIKSDEDPYAAFTDPALLDHGVANLTVTLNTPGTIRIQVQANQVVMTTDPIQVNPANPKLTAPPSLVEVDAPNGSCAGILLRVNTQPLIATPAHCVSGWSSRDLLLTGSSGSTYSASDIRFYPGYDAKLVGRAPAGVAGSYDLALVIPDRAILDTEKPVSYPAEIAQEVLPGAGFESWGFSPNAKDPKTQDLITEPVSFMTSGADPNLFEISSEPTQTLQGSLILQTYPESTSGYRILGLATGPLDDHSVGVNLASNTLISWILSQAPPSSLVRIMNSDQKTCSGVLLSVNGAAMVATLADCVQGSDPSSLGIFTADESQLVPSDLIVHPDFNPETLSDDLAMVVVDSAAFDTVLPIHYPAEIPINLASGSMNPLTNTEQAAKNAESALDSGTAPSSPSLRSWSWDPHPYPVVSDALLLDESVPDGIDPSKQFALATMIDPGLPRGVVYSPAPEASSGFELFGLLTGEANGIPVGLNLASPSYVSWINALMITEQNKPYVRPWMAVLTLENGTRCNAAILSMNWVATSAHCVGSGKNFLVTIRTSNLSDKNALTLHGYQIVVHEEWDPQTYQNDIAIAKVESLPIAEKRGMVRIPAPGEFSPKPGTTSLIGNTWNEVRYPGVAYSNSLLEFPVEVLSLDLANRLLGMGPNSGGLQGSGTLNPERTFASNSPLKSDAIITVEIDGDIYLIGIGSLPPPNTGTGSPSIHTYVPSYLDWLKNYLY